MFQTWVEIYNTDEIEMIVLIEVSIAEAFFFDFISIYRKVESHFYH